MELILKIVAVGILTCIMSLILKPLRPDFALIVSVVGGMIILCMLLSLVESITTTLSEIVSLTGLSSSIYSVVLKIVGVGYLVEFAAGICSDTGNGSLAEKVLLGGKVVVLVMSMPIVVEILEIIVGLLP